MVLPRRHIQVQAARLQVVSVAFVPGIAEHIVDDGLTVAHFHDFLDTTNALGATQRTLDDPALKKGLRLVWFATGKDDFLILDKLVHACIVDAARLCGAKLRVFDHNDLNDLEAKLKWAAERVQSLKSKVQSLKSVGAGFNSDFGPRFSGVALACIF